MDPSVEEADCETESKDEQLMKGQRVKVLVRLRPSLKNEINQTTESLKTNMQEKSVSLTSPNPIPSSKQVLFDSSIDRVPVKKEWTFKFDGVVGPAAKQKDVFEKGNLLKMIRSTLNGYHCTVLAYGQTGSGKTYTMDGLTTTGHEVKSNQERGIRSDDLSSAHGLGERPEKNSSDEQLEGSDAKSISSQDSEEDNSLHGLAPRSINCLFESIRERQYDSEFAVQCSFVQLYKEQFYDLLSADAATVNQEGRQYGRTGLKMRWHSEDGFYLEKLTLVKCSNASELQKAYTEGCRHKFKGSHELNSASSRSHCIFTIYVDRKQKLRRESQAVTNASSSSSRLTLVDLAGSERIRLTRAKGATLKESTCINKSLFVLRKVILSLSAAASEEKKGHLTPDTKHVPYRDSKLTSLLQHSLGGSSYTLIIACLSPCDAHFEENLSTLSYAARASRICNRPIKNEDKQERLIRDLRKQVKDLKEQLRMAHKSMELMKLVPCSLAQRFEQRIQQDTKELDSNGIGSVSNQAEQSRLSRNHPLREQARHEIQNDSKGDVASPGEGYSAHEQVSNARQSMSTIVKQEDHGNEMSLHDGGQERDSMAPCNTIHNSGTETQRESEVIVNRNLRNELIESIAMVKSMHHEQLELREQLDQEQTNANAQNHLNRILQQENRELRDREQLLFQLLMEPSQSTTHSELKEKLAIMEGVPEKQWIGAKAIPPATAPVDGSAQSLHDSHGVRAWLHELNHVRQENEILRDQVEQFETMSVMLQQHSSVTTGEIRNGSRRNGVLRSNQGGRRTAPFKRSNSRFPALHDASSRPEAESNSAVLVQRGMNMFPSADKHRITKKLSRAEATTGRPSTLGLSSSTLRSSTRSNTAGDSGAGEWQGKHMNIPRRPGIKRVPMKSRQLSIEQDPEFRISREKTERPNQSSSESGRVKSDRPGYGHLSVTELKSLLAPQSS